VVSNANRPLKVTSINFPKLWLHVPISEFQKEQKVQGAFPYYLIAVHKEAGNECAHAQLIAHIILLRYKDTSLSTSSETTRILPKTESRVAAWLEFFFRSTLSFFSMSGTKTENSLLGEEQNREERCSSGKVAKASWNKNKNNDNTKLGWEWSFRICGSG
jgi:hypothetical protein